MRAGREPRRRGQQGAVAVITAMLAMCLLAVAALAVDLGHTWASRGQLQVQADRAATFAASYLPADTDEDTLEVAKAVAWYVACHEVGGQRDLDPTIPACPADPSSSTLDTYAASLLADGLVSLPARNQVKVITPDARVRFGFARALGHEGTTQRRTATARVSSPGMLSPMALSLDCLLNTGANLLGGGGLPFGYISTTHHASTDVATTWSGSTQNAPNQLAISPSSGTQQLVGAGPSVRVTGRDWPTLSVGSVFRVVFARGSGLLRQQYSVVGSLVLNPAPNVRRYGYVQVDVPAAVMLTAGTWQVKVMVDGLLSDTFTTEYTTFDVTSLLSLPDDLSCGRMVKSPRGGSNANNNFVLNLQQGIDHLLTTYPYLLGTGGLTRQDLLDLAGLTQCAANDPDTVKDDVRPPATPNCMVTSMSADYERGFTEGMIGAEGRLTCTTAHPCRPGHSFTLNGRQINNDRFLDFVEEPSLLTSETFFNLDTFLTTGLPVVTPDSNLSRDIYSSGRFMWVAVISTVGAVSEVQAGDYPILTFRPVFITQSSALADLPLLDTALVPAPLSPSVVLTALDNLMQEVLVSPNTDQNGLIMDGTDLSAVRFMTISPDALPAVPADYAGPESEYLGVGPKIIRLVQ